jgi:hypothetical protein
MGISQQIVDAALGRLAAEGYSRQLRHLTIREVVRPPGGGFERTSPFTLVVLSDGRVGVGYNLLLSDAERRAYDAFDWQACRGLPAAEAARRFPDADSLNARILGLACLNALSSLLLEAHPEWLSPGSEVIEALDPGPEDVIGMVGWFKGFPGRILPRAGELIVVERRPELLKRSAAFRITSDPEALLRANKVLLTSSSLIDGSLDELLRWTAHAELRVLAGPGASFLPDALFAAGIAAVGGALVRDPEALVARQRAGERWGATRTKYLLQRRSYPLPAPAGGEES